MVEVEEAIGGHGRVGAIERVVAPHEKAEIGIVHEAVAVEVGGTIVEGVFERAPVDCAGSTRKPGDVKGKNSDRRVFRIAIARWRAWNRRVRYDPIDSQLFIGNRERLKALLKPNSIVIVKANDIYPTNADGTMAFKQNSDLFYLTGVDQEDSVLVLMPDAVDPKDREILFVRETTEHVAIWEGEKLTKDQARALSGIEHAPAALELKFTGIGESDFHQGIDARLAEIPGLEYGYCAHIGEVDLRLIGTPEALENGRHIALHAFAPHLVSDDGASLETVVVRTMTASGLKLAIAESCTGGLIAHRITNVPGASAMFTHGFVTYANEAKVELLGVNPDDLSSHGAVSETVALQMAAGALRTSGADIAVSVTGIAGPDGGSPEKPVGTAWIGLATRTTGVSAFKVFHPRNRHDFKLAVSQAALDAVRKFLAAPPTINVLPDSKKD